MKSSAVRVAVVRHTFFKFHLEALVVFPSTKVAEIPSMTQFSNYESWSISKGVVASLGQSMSYTAAVSCGNNTYIAG